MITHATLKYPTINAIKDNVKGTLKELEILEGITQILNKEHRGILTSEDLGELSNLEVWTSNNLTFIENLNKDISERTSKSSLTDKEILEEIVDILYEFSGAKSVLLGLAAMHESVTSLRAVVCNDTFSEHGKGLPDSVSAV